jgi:tagatose 1,6-diphosphate aldolase
VSAHRDIIMTIDGQALPLPTDVGELRDGELALELERIAPADEERGRAPAYQFALRVSGAERPAGHLRLRVGHTRDLEYYIGHIGYDVVPSHRGHHFAERACRLVLPLARRVGLDVLWITCDPDNIASRRTCERLGAELVEVVDVPRDHLLFVTGHPKKCRYRLVLE